MRMHYFHLQHGIANICTLLKLIKLNLNLKNFFLELLKKVHLQRKDLGIRNLVNFGKRLLFKMVMMPKIFQVCLFCGGVL